ncbi:hypothetical protein LSH36_1134g01002 [Paralvinella palmiformis]|uniref:Uncharacterized protein n=1 Tax=Paralvinella palmiformis TaxID=53620 RepID=A0AAD9MQ30_9ANNE|nr:hypothetical protein LSH36_1134g01002 [Paralvinella palmiformis]
MENTFTAKQLAASSNQNASQQPLMKPAMAVNSIDFNHKMDDHSTAGTSGGGVSGSSVRVTGSVQVICESINVTDNVTVSVMPVPESTRQDVRIQPGAVFQKMKELENTDRMEVHRTSSAGFTPMGSQKPKKGSFQITSVINRKQLDSLDRTYEDADSIGDDYDETNTEDLSSEILDTSKMTDIDQDPSSEDTVQSLVIDDHVRGSIALPNSLAIARDKVKQSSGTTTTQQPNTAPEPEIVTGQSQVTTGDDPNFGATRFRIVKVSNERFVRGRWSCYDYQNSERTCREKSNEDLCSGNSSATGSVHYVSGDDLSKKPFVSAGTKLYSNSSSMAGTLLSSDGQPGHSMPKGPIPNGEYATPQPGLVIGGVESAGAHDMTGSTVQPLSVVSQPISSNPSQPATRGYSTPTLGTGGPAAPSPQLPPQDFTTSQPDYIGQSAAPAAIQSSSQPQSIPQQPQAQAVPLTHNISSTVASTESVDIVANSIPPPVASALGEFPPTSGNVGSAAQSSSISPNDTLQAADFMQAEAVYTDDKQSLLSVKEDGMSEAGVAKALMTQAGLTQPLLEMVQTMQNPLGGNRDEDER